MKMTELPAVMRMPVSNPTPIPVVVKRASAAPMRKTRPTTMGAITRLSMIAPPRRAQREARIMLPWTMPAGPTGMATCGVA